MYVDYSRGEKENPPIAKKKKSFEFKNEGRKDGRKDGRMGWKEGRKEGRKKRRRDSAICKSNFHGRDGIDGAGGRHR